MNMNVRMTNHVNARNIVVSSFEGTSISELPKFSSHNDFVYNGMRVAVRSATMNKRNRDWHYRNERSGDTDIFVFVGFALDGSIDHVCVIPYCMMKYDSHLVIYGREQYTYIPYMCDVGGIESKIDSIIDEWDDIETYSDRYRN